MSLVATTSTPEFSWESPVPEGEFWQGIAINNFARAFYQNFTPRELSEMDLDASLSEHDKLKSLDLILASKVASEKAALGTTPLSSEEAKPYWKFLNLQAIIKDTYGDHVEAEGLYREVFKLDNPRMNVGIYGALAHTLRKQGRLSEAHEYAVGSLNHIREYDGLGKDSPQGLGSLRSLMEITARQGQFKEAWKLHAEGVELVDGMTEGKFGKYQGEEKEAMDEMKVTIELLEKGNGTDN